MSIMTDKTHILHALTDDQARRLLRLFDEGATTSADEEALYAYFRHSRLPADLAPLRGLMAWYENGCEGEPEHHAAETKSGRQPWLRRIVAAAASAAILILSGTAILRYHEQKEIDAFAREYAGSYIIRHGVKITDPAEIRADILRAEARMERARQRMAAADPDAALAAAVKRAVGHSPRIYEAAMAAINSQQPAPTSSPQ